MQRQVTFKTIRAAAIGGILTGAAGALTGGTWKTVLVASAIGALVAVAHLYQDNPLKPEDGTAIAIVKAPAE